MTNHLHLLITPESKDQLAVFMQAMANKYVHYFNATRNRTGTIWEGRYKSCLVDSEQYKALFEDIDISKQNERITKATLRGEVYGSSGFHQQIEKLISRPTVLSGHGGDRKSQAYKNQVGRPLDRGSL